MLREARLHPMTIASRQERRSSSPSPWCWRRWAYQHRPEGDLDADGRRRLLGAGARRAGRGAGRARRARGAGRRPRRRRAPRRGRRGGPEPGAARGACSARAARASASCYTLLRADERRVARGAGAAALAGQRQPSSTTSRSSASSACVVGTIVMLRRPAGPRGAALLRDLRCCSSCVLDVVHRQAQPRRLDAALDGHLAILFLPVVFLHFCLSFPERRLAHAARLGDPARLPAGAGR